MPDLPPALPAVDLPVSRGAAAPLVPDGAEHDRPAPRSVPPLADVHLETHPEVRLDPRLDVHVEAPPRPLLGERAARLAAEELADRLVRLQRVSTALVAAATLDDVAQALVAHAAPALTADWGVVAVLEGAREAAALRVLARTGGVEERGLEVGSGIPLADDHPLALVAREGVALHVAEREPADGLPAEALAVMARAGARAMAIVPLGVQGRTLGAFAVGFREARRLDDGEHGLLEAVAAQGALALERVRLAEEERRARTQLDALFEAAPVGLAFFDRELRYVRCNDALAAMNHGLTPADHLGRRPHEVYDSLSIIEPLLRRVLDTGVVLAGQEWDAIADTGHAFRASYYPVPDRDGRPLGVGVIAEDVTHSRLAALDREFLLDLSASLQGAAETDDVAGEALARVGARLGLARCALYEIDVRGDMAVRRAAWVRDGGGPPPPRVHTGGAFAPLLAEARAGRVTTVHDLDADPRAAPLREALRAQAPVQAFCVVPLLRAGRLAAALYAADVAPRPWTLRDRGLLRSVAERVWPAYQTARLLAAEQRAREEAEAARRVAEAANAAKARFLATMSHELRTPLNIIAGHAQLIEMGIHGPVTDPQREALSRVRRSQQHLLALIDDVLTFARLESARVEFRPSSVDLDALLTEALRLVEPLAAAKGVALAGAPGPATHRAWVDEEKARQVVLNLLTNAVKFTPAGGRIAATVTAGADGLLEVHVTDSGVGIPAERLEDIFEPFVQVDGGLTRASEGTGLGLAISRELARRMGGELRASSVVGEGSTFVLSVPAMGRDGNG